MSGELSASAGPRLFGPADLITALRLPLAVAFPLVDDWRWRLAFVGVAGLSDLVDGSIARRLGPSRMGAVLDPVADKIFMLSAFLTLVGTQAMGVLAIWELAAVLARDFAAIAAFVVTLVRRRPIALPARLAGKLVTTGQFLVLIALVMGWEIVRPLAWVTALMGVYAIVDYWRARPK